MYIEELVFAPEELEMPDIPFRELVLEDLPSIDEVLRINPVVMATQPLTAGQSAYTQSITIRIPHWVLAELKKKAVGAGEKYQTYVNLILAQHAVS